MPNIVAITYRDPSQLTRRDSHIPFELPEPRVKDIIEAVDAKGDLLVGHDNSALVKVTVGADGKLLTADSGAAGGVSWQDAPVALPQPLGSDGDILAVVDGSPAWFTPAASGPSSDWDFISAGQNFVQGTALFSVAHGLAGIPTRFACFIRKMFLNVNGPSYDLGYAVGDQISLTTGLYHSSYGGTITVCNATDITLICGSGQLAYMDKSGSPTVEIFSFPVDLAGGEWKIFFYASYRP